MDSEIKSKRNIISVTGTTATLTIVRPSGEQTTIQIDPSDVKKIQRHHWMMDGRNVMTKVDGHKVLLHRYLKPADCCIRHRDKNFQNCTKANLVPCDQIEWRYDVARLVRVYAVSGHDSRTLGYYESFEQAEAANKKAIQK